MAETSLADLYTQSPGTAQVASTPDATSSNATASSANASTYDAQTQDVPEENLTSSRLNTITSQDSPLMQRARSEGMLLAARRGLQNSSIAAGAAEGAMVDRATPLAQQEAGLLQEQRLANQQATNTASQFNAGSQTDVSKLNAQLGTQTSLQNAQNATETSRFNAETKAQAAQQDAQAENAMRTAVMNQNAELNKQYLQGTQSLDLATIQAKYNALIQSNASAASLYNTYFSTIAQVMSNTNMDPSRVAQIVSSLNTSLAGGLDFMSAMSGLDLATGASTGIPTPSVTGGTATQNPSAAGGEAAASLPAGLEASVYGGLLSQAGAIANSAAGTNLAQSTGASGALGTAGQIASGVGGLAQAVGGVQQGGVEGYTQAAAGATQAAGAAGLIGSGLATDIAGGVNIAGQVAQGNYAGAAMSAADFMTGTPLAAAGNIAAALINKAFLGDSSETRNVETFKKVVGGDPIVVPMGHYGLNYYALPDGTLLSQKDFNDLAGAWYGAVFAPDGNQAYWQQQLKDIASRIKPAAPPKGYTWDPVNRKMVRS